MLVRLEQLPPEIRENTLAALRQRRPKLIRDLADGLSTEPGLSAVSLPDLSGILLTMLAAAVKTGWVDARTTSIQDLWRFAPPLTLRQLIRAVHHAERTAIGELSIEDNIGANTESWQLAARAINTAAIDITAVIAETHGATHALRDPLTTLMSAPLFELVLGHEIIRARRHNHGVVMMLFDIDDLSVLNRIHGRGAGDWLLERIGILGRHFFRTHDFVARHESDAIAALLPETPFDQACSLAVQFCEMVRQRVTLVDDKTNVREAVTVSAATVGTDTVSHDFDPKTVLAEAEAAVVRAQMNGGNRMERVALLPTSVTIPGAAMMLGLSNRDILRLLRSGELSATQRGRHRYIERDAIEGIRRRG